MLCSYVKSSIGKKQVVATTGLVLIMFVVMHLAGNLFFYMGAEAFNGYAAKLKSLRPALNFFEAGLLVLFLLHLVMTFALVLQNRKSRGRGYSVFRGSGKQTLSSRTMRWTGPVILIYVVLHLFDYTFADHHGAMSVVNGYNLGLYGLVYNSFLSLGHTLWYIVAMIAVGLHLDHGVQSFFQTFGLGGRRLSRLVRKGSRWFAIIITMGYISIPVYVFVLNRCLTCSAKVNV